jgi:hypothetical protein
MNSDVFTLSWGDYDDDLMANPAAFGIASAGSCMTGGSLYADPERYKRQGRIEPSHLLASETPDRLPDPFAPDRDRLAGHHLRCELRSIFGSGINGDAKIRRIRRPSRTARERGVGNDETQLAQAPGAPALPHRLHPFSAGAAIGSPFRNVLYCNALQAETQRAPCGGITRHTTRAIAESERFATARLCRRRDS